MKVYQDTETELIDRGKLAPPIICYQFAIDDADPEIRLWSDAPITAHLSDPTAVFVLANAAFDLAAIANERPDLLPAILQAYADGRVIDVLLDGKLLDIAAGKYEWAESYGGGWNLAALARRIGIELDKSETWRLRFAALRDVPMHYWPDGAREYATLDITATRAVHLAQLEAAEAWRKHGVEVLGYHSAQAARAAFGLHLASCWGVMTDPARTKHLHDRVEAYLAIAFETLADPEVKLVRPNGSKDTKAAARRMVASCLAIGRKVQLSDGGIKDVKAAQAASDAEADDTGHIYRRELLSKKPAAALDAAWTRQDRATYGEICEKHLIQTPEGLYPLDGIKLDKDCCILAQDEILYLYAEYASANLVRGRCERMATGHVQPLQTRFDAIKETTRTSSTQPQEPLVGEQMQNFPRLNALTRAEAEQERTKGAPLIIGLRECFQPRPGMTFYGADFATAELCSVAQLCIKLFGFSKLADLINAKVDIHMLLASMTLRKSYEECKADPARYEQDRQRCKVGNFGFWGGMGIDKFILSSRKQFQMVFTRPEVVDLRNAWRAMLPETGPYFGRVKNNLGERSSYTDVHPITGFVRGGCEYASGANHGFQHMTAFGAKDAIWKVTEAQFDRRSAMYGSRMWNFAHDEILMEGPIDRAPEAAAELALVMANEFNKIHPDVKTHAEPFVTPIWSKKAKPVYDTAGQLIPCTWTLPEGLAA